MNNFSKFLEELQRGLKGLTAGIDTSYTTRALAEAISQIPKMTASLDTSYMAKALAEAVRPALEITVSMDFSHSARALLGAMRPLIVDNQQFHAAMLSNMAHMTSSMAGILSSPDYRKCVMNSIEGMQDMFADLVKSFDLSSYGDVLSQISARLNEIGVDGDFDINEEQQAELKADLAVIADDDKKVSRYEKFNKMIRKWHDKNFAVFFLLFYVLPLFFSFYSFTNTLQNNSQQTATPEFLYTHAELDKYYTLFSALYDMAKQREIITPQATIRALPNPKAEAVIQVEQQEWVTVIDSQNHWVKVVYLNPEDGLIYEGWLSKRSSLEVELEEQEEPEDAEDIEDAENEEVDDDEQEKIDQ